MASQGGFGDTHVFYSIVFFLAAFVALTGFLNLCYDGTITFSTLGGAIGSGAIPGQYTPNANLNIQTAYSQDYTNSSGFNTNISQPSGYWGLDPFIPIWTQENGTGYVCTQVPFYPWGMPAQLVLNGVLQNSAGVYDVTYYIDNPSGSPFYIAISTFDYIGYYLEFDSAGVHLQQLGSTGFGSDLTTYLQYPDAALTSGPETYEIQYNPNTASAAIIINGNTVGTVYNIPAPATSVNIPAGQVGAKSSISSTSGTATGTQYGGVATYTTGFTLEQVISTFQINVVGNSVGTDPLAAIGSFFSLIAQMLGVTGGGLFPAWFTIPIIGTCTATLIYLYFRLLRGV